LSEALELPPLIPTLNLGYATDWSHVDLAI